jgi:hypothetical protein
VNTYRAVDLLDPAERAQVKGLWGDLRGPTYVEGKPVSALDAVPELAPSLELLTQEGYSVTDIANMFGLSQRTVRGWLAASRIPRAMVTQGRVWSDVANRFVPITATLATILHIRTPNPVKSAISDVARIGQARRHRPLASHCTWGHPLTPETTVGARQCRICRRRRDKVRRQCRGPAEETRRRKERYHRARNRAAQHEEQ